MNYLIEILTILLVGIAVAVGFVINLFESDKNES